MNVDTVTIDGRIIGDGRVFVIAELSANHGGSIAKAKETIHAAADAGADAVKLQTYRPESITLESDQPVFRRRREPLVRPDALRPLSRGHDTVGVACRTVRRST